MLSQPRLHRHFVSVSLIVAIMGCQSGGGSIDVVETGMVPAGAVHADDLLVVDCLLQAR
jgi:hypothetical protein